eukprot:7426330-Pyramimonas_sp.AAC.1
MADVRAPHISQCEPAQRWPKAARATSKYDKPGSRDAFVMELRKLSQTTFDAHPDDHAQYHNEQSLSAAAMASPP